MVKDVFLSDFTKDKGFIDKLGIKIKSIDEKEALFYINLKEKHLNPMGIVHGGVVYSLADTTMGSILFYNKNICVTISANINYLKPCKGKIIYCKAKELKSGKNISFYEATITNEDGDVLATCSGSYLNINYKFDNKVSNN